MTFFDKVRERLHHNHHDDDVQRQGPEPGKGTLVDQQATNRADTTNDEYIDKGSEHAGKGDDIFNAGQRSRLINAFQQRTLAADSAFKSALTQVRVDKLIEKPEDMSWVLNLALMALGAYGGVVLGRVLGELTSQATSSLVVYLEGETGPRMTKLATKLHAGISAISLSYPKRAGLAYKAHAAGITAAQGWQAKMTGKEDIDFLDILGSQTGVMFQRIRETGMLGLTDAELLALHEAWDVQRNSVGDYKQQITALIAEYKTSQIKHLGRSGAVNPFAPNGQDPGVGQKDYAQGVNADSIDRFVVRLFFQSGEPSRYAIADKYIDPGELPNPFTGQFGDSRKIKPGDLKEGEIGGNALKYTMEKYSLIKLVHPDLEQVAVLKHREKWHMDPKTLVVNDAPRAKVQGPSWDGSPVQGDKHSTEDPNVYNIKKTKNLNWDDPKTWEYANAHTKGARNGSGYGHDAKEDPWYER
jgi:hypothetical protein